MTLELMLTSDRFHSVGIKISGISLAGSLKMPHRQVRKYNNDYRRKRFHRSWYPTLWSSGARILTTRYYQNDYSRNNYSDDKYHQPRVWKPMIERYKKTINVLQKCYLTSVKPKDSGLVFIHNDTFCEY